MNKILLSIFLLLTTNVYATDVSIPTTYATNGSVTSVNLNGNFQAIAAKINGGLDNDNADTTNGYHFFRSVAALPSAGSQGSVYFLTSDNTLNLDTGSAFVKSVVVTGTPSSNQVPVYNGSAWVPTTTANLGMPSGAVIMWYGSLASIPSGYQQCDGTNSTPDLRGKLIPASATGIAPGTVSGTTYVPPHTHVQTSHRHSLATNIVSGGRNSLETVNSGAQVFHDDATQVDGGGDATASTGSATLYALAYICKT